MLPGKDTSVRFDARLTATALTRGGVLLRLAAASSSSFVVPLRGRYPARSAEATTAPASSTTLNRVLFEVSVRPNILIPSLQVDPGSHRHPLQSARRDSSAASCGASYT